MSHAIDELYELYDERETVARKPHDCDACDDTIEPGHRYFRIAIAFRGDFESLKRCLRCQAIHKHLREKGNEWDRWPSERLDCGEEYEATWGESPPEEIAALAFATPLEMQARRARGWDDER